MILQIGERKIGNVVIVDIKGDLSGTGAVRGRNRIAQALSRNNSCKFIFNLRETMSLDTLGTKSILESLPEGDDLSVIPGNLGVLDLVKRYLNNRRLRLYRNELEIASAFGRDFVKDEALGDARGFKRLETAFPLEFYFEDRGDSFEFRAIVTNLSQSGLFAEYIDLTSAEETLKRLDPYDLKLLHLRLFLPMRKPVACEGNVVHRRLDGDQLGIGVQLTNLGEKEASEIQNFLNSRGISNQDARKAQKGR